MKTAMKMIMPSIIVRELDMPDPRLLLLRLRAADADMVVAVVSLLAKGSSGEFAPAP